MLDTGLLYCPIKQRQRKLAPGMGAAHCNAMNIRGLPKGRVWPEYRILWLELESADRHSMQQSQNIEPLLNVWSQHLR